MKPINARLMASLSGIFTQSYDFCKMIDQKNIIPIGKFQKTHALKGELNALLDVDCEFLTEKNALILDVDGIYVPFFADSIRPKGSSSFLIKLDGIDSEADAKRFVNKTIFALKAELAPFLEMEEDEFADEDDLIGYEIKDDSGHLIGKIESIDSTTSNVLFIVSTNDDKKIYIPAAEEFVMSIDDENKIINMRLPEGLIDLN